MLGVTQQEDGALAARSGLEAVAKATDVKMLKVVLLGVGVLLGAVLVAAIRAGGGPFIVYMSASGSDANDGMTPATGVYTLKRVQQILKTADPDSDVEVRIQQGTYHAPPLTWDYTNGHRIAFLPIDYEYGEGREGIADRPVFRGDGTLGWWFAFRLPPGHPGGDTRLEFYYLRVEHYDNGLLFHGRYHTVDGIRVPATAGANGNRVQGMYFYEIGSRYVPGDMGYAALEFANSSNNYVRANHFIRIENASPDESHIHGIYAAHGANNNQVINNNFHRITGQPIRTRNQSNNNDIYGNKFERTGLPIHGQYGEWFCDPTCQASSPSNPLECASQGNLFHDNTLVSNYQGGPPVEYQLTPPGLTYPGPAGCPPLTAPRVAVSDNA